MLGKSILLYTRDRSGARRLCTCLRAAGNEVAQVNSPATARELIGARAVNLVLFDYAERDDLDELAWAAYERVPFAVLSTSIDPDALLECVCDLAVPHFVSSGGGGDGLASFDAREVVVTAEKILRNDIFGAKKYLPDFAVNLSTVPVRGADDRDDVIDCVQDYLGWLGAGRDIRQAMGLVVDELVTNAVYNAPRDERGRARYARCDRREKIVLDPWEHAQVEFGSDGRLFVLSVTDWFGALGPRHIRAGLRRCFGADDPIEQKAGGAGLGLYTVLSSVSQLVVNVQAGRRTEVIAIVNLTSRMRGVRERGHSLHLFTHEEAAAEAHAGDSVVVAPELRRELFSTLAARGRKAEVVPLLQPIRRHPRASSVSEPTIVIGRTA